MSQTGSNHGLNFCRRNLGRAGSNNESKGSNFGSNGLKS